MSSFKQIKLHPVFLIIIALLLFAVGCEGPEGPAGPIGEAGLAGDTGAPGDSGATGETGATGTLACLTCHSDENMTTIETSFALSGHAAGNYVGYAGGRGSCSRCHSSEGFENFLQGGEGVDIASPSAWTCSTCHSNHSSLEDDLTVPLVLNSAIASISLPGTTYDFENSSNLCGTCHQSRRGYDYYEAIDSVWTDDVNGDDSLAFVVGDGEVYINSSHAGPHHGPQTNTLFGEGGYGTSSLATHSSQGCTSCHMGEADATEGGHSFNPNIANCNVEGCHTSETSFDINSKQTDFNTRMGVIAEALVTAGALSGDAIDGYHPHVGIVTDAQFKAFFNYMVLYEDHSHGVHNPGYFNTLLTVAETNLGL
ncbi:MAG: collagen-like protein [Candidatus Marinimicrobia bacterium]|nr:collagen-like protein [Candidatus Neomarinimicrobiota bacterium]